MPNVLVKNWFGDKFSNLHPLLQKLHTEGGRLTGDVEISYGKGLAGVIGVRLAKKMSLPSEGTHQLVVSISHDIDGLHWDRCFNNQALVKSLFKPVGHVEDGYWIETTGPLSMKLTVDINDGGWFWRVSAQATPPTNLNNRQFYIFRQQFFNIFHRFTVRQSRQYRT
ncbi:DUF4166 domain-containing protein [Thalassolituus oleivorans]|uniref:DUF4166 domain-containing protein n=1 Tax=Thalassolituus oleivorans TaxID=187493 RepID=UPI0009DD08F9|nr:DUF4166 domain-containing protein [Thalassolituus oleivorans]